MSAEDKSRRWNSSGGSVGEAGQTAPGGRVLPLLLGGHVTGNEFQVVPLIVSQSQVCGMLTGPICIWKAVGPLSSGYNKPARIAYGKVQ